MASRFWVGGTGTWDSSTTTHWSASSGGAGGASAPTTGDDVTLDGSSGGGTVTAAANISGLSLNTLACGAFTGTLDFSANNPSLTISGGSFNISGSGTRTINMGSGTFTFTQVNGTVWDATTITNLTFNAGTSTIATSGTITGSRLLNLNTLTYSTISLGSTPNAPYHNFSGAFTAGTLNITAPNTVQFSTCTITNAFNWAGSSSNQLFLQGTSNPTANTITVASGSPTMSWAGIRSLTFSGGATFTATSSFDLHGTTGITITPPSGRVGMIGG